MSSRLVVFVLATLVGWTAELGATLIVTYRSANEIIIAADSLRTINTAQPTRVLACKIRNFGTWCSQLLAAAAVLEGYSRWTQSLKSFTRRMFLYPYLFGPDREV